MTFRSISVSGANFDDLLLSISNCEEKILFVKQENQDLLSEKHNLKEKKKIETDGMQGKKNVSSMETLGSAEGKKKITATSMVKIGFEEGLGSDDKRLQLQGKKKKKKKKKKKTKSVSSVERIDEFDEGVETLGSVEGLPGRKMSKKKRTAAMEIGFDEGGLQTLGSDLQGKKKKKMLDSLELKNDEGLQKKKKSKKMSVDSSTSEMHRLAKINGDIQRTQIELKALTDLHSLRQVELRKLRENLVTEMKSFKCFETVRVICPEDVRLLAKFQTWCGEPARIYSIGRSIRNTASTIAIHAACDRHRVLVRLDSSIVFGPTDLLQEVEKMVGVNKAGVGGSS